MRQNKARQVAYFRFEVRPQLQSALPRALRREQPTRLEPRLMRLPGTVDRYPNTDRYPSWEGILLLSKIALARTRSGTIRPRL